MTKRAADGFSGAPAATVLLCRLDVPRVVETKLAQRMLGLTIEFDALVHAGEVTQHDTGPAKLLVHVKNKRVVMLPAFAMGAACDQLAGQRSSFEPTVIVV